jgi:hypothetical protein
MFPLEFTVWSSGTTNEAKWMLAKSTLPRSVRLWGVSGPTLE